MATATATASEPSPSGVALVDPRAPRFGQTLTALGLLAGIALREPLFVFGVAVVLVTAVLSGWRVDAWGTLWRHGAMRVVGEPAEREPAAPHRFAKLMGAGFTAVASAFLLAGVPLAGYALAALVAALAGVAAATDVCLGCRMYQQVSFFRRLGVV